MTMTKRIRSRKENAAIWMKAAKYKIISPHTAQVLSRPRHGGIRASTIRMIRSRVRYQDKVRKEKYERCVRDVKPVAGTRYNPYAVCRASTKY